MAKVKIINTGEIVNIVSWGATGSYTDYYDSKGEFHHTNLNRYNFFEDIIEYTKDGAGREDSRDGENSRFGRSERRRRDNGSTGSAEDKRRRRDENREDERKRGGRDKKTADRKLTGDREERERKKRKKKEEPGIGNSFPKRKKS